MSATEADRQRRQAYLAELRRWHAIPDTCVLCGETGEHLRPGAVGRCPANNNNGHLLRKNVDQSQFPLLYARSEP